MSAGKTVARLAGPAALLALLVASKQPQEREWPLSPEDENWHAEYRYDRTAHIQSSQIRGEIDRKWNVNKDAEWCREDIKESILRAIDRNTYWGMDAKDPSVYGEYFPPEKVNAPDTGPLTVIRERMNRENERAVVIHEAMHDVGFPKETWAWKPVKCLGRYAEKPGGTGTPGGGGGGGKGGGGNNGNEGGGDNGGGDNELWDCEEVTRCSTVIEDDGPCDPVCPPIETECWKEWVCTRLR